MLGNYNDLFVRSDEDLGHTTLVEHTIDTGENHPCKQPPRRLPLAQRDIADVEVDKLLVRGLIEPCDSPWASPIVLVTKKDGSTRFCIDYRRLNNVTRKDAFQIPRIDENFEALSGAEWFSTLDMASGYWQVSVAEQDRHKTAFCTRKGLFQWRVLPFGLSNAPSTFSRLMELVLRGILWERCLVYLDDIIIFGRDFESALENLRHVFDRLRRAGLKLKAKKCKLFQKTVKFLGHVVSKEGVQCDPEKVECVQNWKVPECVTEVRSFLGLASYYRRFIPQYAQIADPLTRLTEKGRKFTWNDQCQQAFEALKQKLVTAPVLAYPQTEGLMVLDTDASAVSISGCVSQIQNGEERVIAYGSKALSAAQRRYCTTKRELLAVVKFVKYYRTYLWGRHFMVRTDHASLRWLLNFKDPEGMLARWLSVLNTYDFEIVHRPGAKHNNADSLTRQSNPIVGMPWERIAMDIMGPLPKSNSGNLYILVIGDYFTKWTESYALKDHTAQTIADVLVNQWICRFGVPRRIHTDQGRDFESNLIHEMCHLLDIEKTRTCPYRPQSDGMVERFNRTLAQMLATFARGHRGDWDEHLPFVMLAYRSTVHQCMRAQGARQTGWYLAVK